MQWLATIKDAIADALAVLAIDLPAILDRLGDFFSDQVWPLFLEVLAQPLLWLAVAALVFGSRVLSLAELWRKGQPYAAAGARRQRLRPLRRKRALRRVGPPPRGVRLAAAQIRQAFFGDLDDKYLPTFHSLRLVLRAGVVFLGSYVLVYSLVADRPELLRDPAPPDRRRPRATSSGSAGSRLRRSDRARRSRRCGCACWRWRSGAAWSCSRSASTRPPQTGRPRQPRRGCRMVTGTPAGPDPGGASPWSRWPRSGCG